MAASPARKDSWPTKSAVLISALPMVSTFVRDKIGKMGWRVMATTTSLEDAHKLIHKGEVTLIIIDDMELEPCSSVIRRFIGDPLGVLTPTLALVSEARSDEADAIARMGCPEIVMYPITPGKVDGSLRSLFKRWEAPFYEAVRHAARLVTLGKVETGLRLLTQINNANPPSSLATQSLAYFYRKLKEHKTAEKILLAALQKSPNDLGCILSLSDLYLHASMPAFAYRLLSGAHRGFPKSIALLPELIQACVMVEKYAEAIDFLFLLQAKGYLSNSVPPMLAKLLLAESRGIEVEQLSTRRNDLTKQIFLEWTAIEESQPAAPPAVAS